MKETKRKIRSAVLAVCLALLLIFISAHAQIGCHCSGTLDDAAEILPSEPIAQISSGVRSTQFQSRSWTNSEFTNYNESDGLSSKYIKALQLDSVRQKLYIGGNGLTIYDIANNTFTTKFTDDGLSSNRISSLVLDSITQSLYIGTDNGLTIYNITADIFVNKSFWFKDENNQTLKDTEINALELDKENNILYIGTYYRNLIIYYITDGSYSVNHIGDWHYLLEWHGIYQMGLDSDDNKLYLDAGNRFYVYYTLNDTLIDSPGLSPFLLDGKNNRMYGEGTVYRPGIYQGISWIPGLVVYNTSDMSRVDEKTVEDGIPHSNASLFSAFALDSLNNILYMGMLIEGICIYDVATGQLTNKTEENGLISNDVLALALDAFDEKLYIGTTKGLSIYNLSYVDSPPTITHIPVSFADTNSTISIHAIIEDDNGVTFVSLSYMGVSEQNFTHINMTLSSGNFKNGTWFAEIPPQNFPGNVSYYIISTDGVNIVTLPHNFSLPYYTIEIRTNINTGGNGESYLRFFDKYGLISLSIAIILISLLSVVFVIIKRNREKGGGDTNGKRIKKDE